MGILPLEIQKLSNLVTLTLTGNANLTGPLPPEIGSIPLNVLDLHDNGFNGTLPKEISRLSNLLIIDLSGNRFEGPFPTFFILSVRTALQVFKLARNLFEGDIPQNAFQNMTELLTMDLSRNKFTGPPPNLTFSKNLNNLNLSSNLFTGFSPLPLYFSSLLPSKLSVVDLSDLNIGGGVPDWHSLELPRLENLYLDSNNIAGVLDISAVVGSSFGRTLRVLSMKNNNITNVVYTNAFIDGAQPQIFLQGNPYCEGSTKEDDGKRCYCQQVCFLSPSSSGRKSDLRVIIISTSCSGVILALVVLIYSFVLHRNRMKMRSLYEKIEKSEVNAKRFEYNQLRVATCNFSPKMKLGTGAFGAVYKGILPNHTVVAVKQLFLKTKEACDDFVNEVLLITNLQHRNLVCLKGYSLRGKEMLLVYEYVENGDLEKLLFSAPGGSTPQALNWQARMNICMGVAQGLYYLHASSQSRIIHRDIKASNILLDQKLHPKIADFGLARPLQDECSHIVTDHRAGTLGYLAPEYLLFGQLSEKADVFSFGVLLLEIITGRKNRNPKIQDNEYLPIYACRLHGDGKLMDLLDRRLQLDSTNTTELKQVHRVLKAAILCAQMSPEQRPTMFRVLTMLAGDVDVEVPKTIDTISWSEFRSHQLSGSSSTATRSRSTMMYGDVTVELSSMKSILTNQILAEASC